MYYSDRYNAYYKLMSNKKSVLQNCCKSKKDVQGKEMLVKFSKATKADIYIFVNIISKIYREYILGILALFYHNLTKFQALLQQQNVREFNNTLIEDP